MAVLSIYVTFGVFRAGMGGFVPLYQSSFPLLHGGCQLLTKSCLRLKWDLPSYSAAPQPQPNPCQPTGSDEGKKQHGRSSLPQDFGGGEGV